MDYSEQDTPTIDNRCGFVHIPRYPTEFHRANLRERSSLRNAVFLDRDGVLIEDTGYLSRTKDMVLIPGVVDALKLLSHEYYLIVVTNQSGIARGLFSELDLIEIHEHLVFKLWSYGAMVDAIYYCPHLDQGIVSNYRVHCSCRKPASGMLEKASKDFGINLDSSYLVGDKLSDMEAAVRVNVRGIRVVACPEEDASPAHVSVKDLTEAASVILNC